MNKRLSLHDALTICQGDVARPVLASWIEQNGLVRLCHETGPLKEAEKLIIAALRTQSESVSTTKDAARYRWLREKANHRHDLYEGGRAAVMIGNFGESLDAEIDRRMKRDEK